MCRFGLTSASDARFACTFCALNVGLERLRIVFGPQCVGMVPNAELIKELRGGMIARKRKHMLGRNLTLVTVLSDLNAICRYLQNAPIQIWCYLALLETVLDIRTNPILHCGSKFCPAMYQ